MKSKIKKRKQIPRSPSSHLEEELTKTRLYCSEPTTHFWKSVVERYLMVTGSWVRGSLIEPYDSGQNMKLKLSGNDKFINQRLQCQIMEWQTFLKLCVLLIAIFDILLFWLKIDYKTCRWVYLAIYPRMGRGDLMRATLWYRWIMAEDFVGISLKRDQYDKPNFDSWVKN